jgi:hypothetical protein
MKVPSYLTRGIILLLSFSACRTPTTLLTLRRPMTIGAARGGSGTTSTGTNLKNVVKFQTALGFASGGLFCSHEGNLCPVITDNASRLTKLSFHRRK